MLIHRLRRASQIFTSPTYRRVLICRLLCHLLHRLNPSLRYLGMTAGDETTFLHLRDNVVTPYTVAVGDFARGDLLRVIALCEGIGSPMGGTFLDIGGNIGTTTLYAMRSGKFNRGLCVEPEPENLRLVRLNMEANGLADQVVVRANAVSNKRGVMQLALSRSNFGDHRVVSTKAKAAQATIDVQVETLDDILKAENIAPEGVSLVWVDTQGHEGFVMSGAKTLIAKRVPFCIEFWPQILKETRGFELLLEIIERDFEKFVDLGAGDGSARPTSEIRAFAERFDGTMYHTDLFLVPR